MAARLPPRPRVRGDCGKFGRPCPWVSCRHHLALDVNGERIRVYYEDPLLMPPDRSCSLDLADRGGMSLEEVRLSFFRRTGSDEPLSRERIRQIEEKALRKVRED